MQIQNVKITDVQLPLDLQRRLEETTSFRTRIEEEEKRQTNVVRVIDDDAKQKVLTLTMETNRRVQELEAEIRRLETQAGEEIREAEGLAEVAATKARTQRDVAIAEADGALKRAEVDARAETRKVMQEAKVGAAQRLAVAEQEGKAAELSASAKLAAARSEAEALIAQGEAEQRAATELAPKRAVELEWHRLHIMGQLAGKGRKLVSGEQGAGLISEMIPMTMKR